jgi:hypothetical protein
MRDRHRRLAGGRDPVDAGGLEPGTGITFLKCGGGVQLDLPHVGDDAKVLPPRQSACSAADGDRNKFPCQAGLDGKF